MGFYYVSYFLESDPVASILFSLVTLVPLRCSFILKLFKLSSMILSRLNNNAELPEKLPIVWLVSFHFLSESFS